MQLVLRDIREGICIPLDVKPDLVSNITTRNGVCGQCAEYKLHCCLPCAPRVYSIRIGYCILVFTILPVLWGMWLE